MSSFDKKHLAFPIGTLPGRDTPIPIAILYTVNSHSITNIPDGMEITTFAMDCFWNVGRLFWQLPGIHSTAAGYTGGYAPNPIYREVCSGSTGHAEAVHTVYDPSVISYEQLLRALWGNHDPTQGIRWGDNHGIQYRSTIYPLIPGQDAATRVSLERFQAAMLATDDDCHITTEIANATPFYYVEDDRQQCLHKDPRGYYGIGRIGVCLPPEAQRYGYRYSLLIKCSLPTPDATRTAYQVYKVAQIRYIARAVQA